MKLKPAFIKNYQITISYLFILLFVYAAVSKIIDFQNFQAQLGQSPLLSAFASWVSWLVLILELGIVVLLIFPKLRTIGLLASTLLMTLFTAYIFIILNYSSFVPCSCGGILEKMSWNTHLIFNIFFILLPIIGLILEEQLKTKTQQNNLKTPVITWILLSMACSIATMIALFLSSEQMMHHENPFIRRYPQHPIAQTHSFDLKYNSYYFAGFDKGKIYLGNITNPLHLIAMDSTLNHSQDITIGFDPKNIPFKMVTIMVRGSYFYLMDGRVPTIFRGKTQNWQITRELKGIPYFTKAEPIDSTTIVFKSNNGKKLANIVGVFSTMQQPKTKYNDTLLQQQLDGIFDTDGLLMYSEKMQKAVYLYFYRNEFMITDKEATLLYRAHTIDTNTHAKIKVAYLKNRTERKMAAPPYIVNAHASICEHLLFVHSKVKGQYENEKLWEQAFIIDVYDLNKKTYVMSFALYGIKNEKLNSFLVTPTHLYAIIGNTLVVNEIRTILKKEMKSVEMKKL